jgi:hypothetical protein
MSRNKGLLVTWWVLDSEDWHWYWSHTPTQKCSQRAMQSESSKQIPTGAVEHNSASIATSSRGKVVGDSKTDCMIQISTWPAAKLIITRERKRIPQENCLLPRAKEWGGLVKSLILPVYCGAIMQWLSNH